MFTVRGTKKFLDRVGRPIADPPSSSTALGDWLSVWLANTIVGPKREVDGYTPLGALQRVVATAAPDS